MKILMLNNEFPPLGGGTGISNFYHLRELAKCKKLNINLITTGNNDNKYIENFSDNTKIHRINVLKKNLQHATLRELIVYSFKAFRLSLALDKQTNFDICFAYSGLPAGVIALLLKWFLKIPYIVSIQGSDIPWWDKHYYLLYPFLLPLIKIVWRSAEAIIVLSEKQREIVLKNAPGLKTELIYNGVCKNTFPPRLYNLNQDKNVNIICVGRLLPHKGQRTLVKMFSDLTLALPKHKLSLTLVGGGKDELYLEKLIEALSLSKKIKIEGIKSQTDLAKLYQKADIFALYSDNEGMANVFLEAAASGLALVVTNVGGAKEVIEDGKNGYIVQKSDSLEFYKKLELLCKNQTLRISMGKNSLEKSKDFTWIRVTDKLVDLLKRLGFFN